MEPGHKACAECGDVRPDQPLHFPLFRKRTEMCLACVTAARRRKQDKKRAYRDKKMSKMEEQAVDAMLSTVSRGGGNVPHSAELLEQVMTFFGGVNGFAGILLKQFFDSKPGSPTRTKMLEMVTRLVTTNADQGGSLKPLTMWTDEELNEELDERLQQAVVQMLPQQRLEIEVLGKDTEEAIPASKSE
jgi:ribosomal protein L13